MKYNGLILALVLAIGAVLPAAAAQGTAPGPVVGQPAPAFDLPTIDGSRVTLAGLRGKTVVINVWATWCPPCREETPDLIKAYKQLASDDVVFVGVDSTETAQLVKAFAVAKNIRWTEAVDKDQSFSNAYGIKYFPTTYVIGPDGVLRMTYIDVVTPKLLAGFVADAQANRNSELHSPMQTQIDGLLAPSRYNFHGTSAQVMAAIERFNTAVDRVTALIDNSDPVAGNPIDTPRTEAEENTVRVAAVSALAPIASTAKQKLTLALLQGDVAAYEGNNAAALVAYRKANAIDPKNTDALDGISRAARQLKKYTAMLDADAALVKLKPASVPAWVGYGIDCGTARQFERGRREFAQAVAVASVKANAPGAKAKDIRMLAWAHLYWGRMEAKAANFAAGKRQFALTTQTTLRLPKKDPRYVIYLEQAQEESVALDLRNVSRKVTALSLAPWTGPELPGSSPDTAKYRLVVTGKPGQSIALRATGLPQGWIASFCTDRICSPLRVSTSLPDSGVKIIEFQVVPPDAKDLAHVPSVQVIASDGKSTASARTLAMR